LVSLGKTNSFIVVKEADAVFASINSIYFTLSSKVQLSSLQQD